VYFYGNTGRDSDRGGMEMRKEGFFLLPQKATAFWEAAGAVLGRVDCHFNVSGIMGICDIHIHHAF
jgi:hypothetical protein